MTALQDPMTSEDMIAALVSQSKTASDDAHTAVGLVMMLFVTLVEKAVIPVNEANAIVNHLQLLPAMNDTMLNEMREALRRLSV